MINKNLKYLGFAFIFSLSFYVFYYTVFIETWQPYGNHEVSDLSAHVKQVLRSIEMNSFPAYSIWYRIVNIVSGFSISFKKVALTSMLLLAGLVAWKFLINYAILESARSLKKNKILVFLISIALIFVMPLLTYYTLEDYPNRYVANNFHVYLGNIAPNQWHNSTLLLAMPFSIIWFFYSIKYYKANHLRPFFIMSILASATILCKPNFAMAFLPVLCSLVFLTNLKNSDYKQLILKLLILGLPSTLLLTYQWYFTFVEGGSYLAHPTGTIIAPFLVWRLYSPHLITSALVSIAFPLAIAIFYFKKMDKFLQMAWFTFLVALAMFITLAEYPSYAAADYEWASIAANYILFLFSARLLLEQPFDWKSKISYAIFLVHFLSGCFLLVSFFLKQTSLRI
ncbi:MAG: hypothetical protein LCH30_04310 [Proteobacteria bacterium]|nr:hypothetical protein [Pseudomonadota bacterium]